MKLDDSSATHDAGRFQTTRWSAILLSAQSQAHGLRATLADWPRLYWHPLYAFVRRRGYNAVALTPDGRRVVWVSAAGALGIWDLERDQTARMLDGHMSWVNSLSNRK
jgi:WD40 repeat protein